jgi:hypothetical protein
MEVARIESAPRTLSHLTRLEGALAHDGHPQHVSHVSLALSAFGDEFVLDLERSDALFADRLAVVTQHGEGRVDVQRGIERCFYHGQVRIARAHARAIGSALLSRQCR